MLSSGSGRHAGYGLVVRRFRVQGRTAQAQELGQRGREGAAAACSKPALDLFGGVVDDFFGPDLGQPGRSDAIPLLGELRAVQRLHALDETGGPCHGRDAHSVSRVCQLHR
ncbi:hypothetical protein G6F68_018122 [Rhizopus microsporus]|nr:hypothetical protein G6F68_018122 [Rhizopus microsporus]